MMGTEMRHLPNLNQRKVKDTFSHSLCWFPSSHDRYPSLLLVYLSVESLTPLLCLTDNHQLPQISRIQKCCLPGSLLFPPYSELEQKRVLTRNCTPRVEQFLLFPKLSCIFAPWKAVPGSWGALAISNLDLM